MSNDPFRTLQVDRSASEQQIRRAYYRLVRRYHPDRNRNDPDAIEHFKQVQRAYEQIARRAAPARHTSVIRATTCGIGSTINVPPPKVSARAIRLRIAGMVLAASLLLTLPVTGPWAVEKVGEQVARWAGYSTPDVVLADASPPALPTRPTRATRPTRPTRATDEVGIATRRATDLPPVIDVESRVPTQEVEQPIVPPIPAPSQQPPLVAAEGQSTPAPETTEPPPARQSTASADDASLQSLLETGQQVRNALDTMRDRLDRIARQPDVDARTRSSGQASRTTTNYRAPLPISEGTTANRPRTTGPTLPELSTIDRAGRSSYRSLAFDALPAATPQALTAVPSLRTTPTTLPPISYTSQWDKLPPETLATPSAPPELSIPPVLQALPK